MFGLFALLTVKLMAAGIVSFAIIETYMIAKGNVGQAIGNLIANGIYFFLVYGITYCVLPAISLSSIIGYNLLNLSIMLLIQGGILSIGNYDNSEVNSIVMIGGISTFGLAIVVGTIFGIVSLGDAKAVANNAPVYTHETIKDAPMPEISQGKSEMPVVNTTDTAKTQMKNSLGDIANSNVYSLDHIRAQIYQGKLNYVAPLDFDDFFKYVTYKKIPGYFIVDATNKNASPKFVKKDMYYTPAAYFGKDAGRNIYAYTANSGYIMMSNDPQLEIDDKGEPYYVSTLTKRYGVTSRTDYKDKAVATINAKTGKVNFYTNLNKKPSWLDIAVDPTTAADQVSSWGRERNGWANANMPWGSQSGVMVADENVGTEGDNNELIPMKYHNNIFYLETMTSAKSNQTSVLGYMYTDASTGKSYYYKENSTAMTPTRANKLAEDLMKQTGWNATMPLLYKIDGKPTWVVSMLDSSDAFRNYVYLLASGNGTQSTVAKGDDADSTLENYRNLFTTATATSSDKAKTTNVTGTVSRTVLSGNTLSFLMKDSNIIYSVSVKDYPLAQFIQSGDTVSFRAKVYGNVGTVSTSINNQQLKN